MPVKKPAGSSKALHSHISDEESARTLTHASWCLKVLRLSHWDVELAYEPADINNHAETKHTAGRYIATLYVPTDWAEKDTDLKRRVVMHEMLHTIHAHQEHGIRTHLEDKTMLSADVWDPFIDQYRLDTEYMVDQLTSVLWDVGAVPRWPRPSDIKNLTHINSKR